MNMSKSIVCVMVFIAFALHPLAILADKTGCVSCKDYFSSSAAEKLSRLWYQVESTAYTKPFPAMKWPTDQVPELFAESKNAVFDQYNDELPANRKRLVHAFGAVGLVTFEVKKSKYTGIYKSGSRHAIMRLSLSKDPTPADGVFSPGFAIKFLRNGQYSANLIGMYELVGHGKDYNFFSIQLKTKVAVPESLPNDLKALQASFESGAYPADTLGVDAPALYDEEGKLYTEPKSPASIYLVPSQAMKEKNFSTSEHDWRNDLASITPGNDIYDVYATDIECMCGAYPCVDVLSNLKECKAEKLGTIRAKSSFIPSKYGDERIFFQHSRWSKKTRLTCTYSSVLDGAHRDSTVLTADPRSDCQSNDSCIARENNNLVSTTSGCPFDKYLKNYEESKSTVDSNGMVITGILLAIFSLITIFFIINGEKQNPKKNN